MNTCSFQILWLWCVTIVFFNLAPPAASAGVSTHLYVAFKAQYFYPDITKDNLQYYYAGAFFPDAFYDCFGLSQLAEAAHWPPFLKESVIYYQDQYTKKGIENEALKAFIFGIFTHQYADVPWHSLKSSQGLLKVVAETDFSGDESAAHNYLDTVGDFILLNKQLQNLSKESEKLFIDNILMKWKYPTDDIINISKRIGFNQVSNIKLKVCMERGYSALQGEINTILSERVTGNWLSSQLTISPFTVSIINNYYYGGIDQIVHTLHLCAKELEEWFDQVPYPNSWHLCSPAFGHTETLSSNYTQTPKYYSQQQGLKVWTTDNIIYLSTGVSNSKFGSALCIGNFLGEKTLVISAPYEELDGAIYMIPLKDLLENTSLKAKNLSIQRIKPVTEITETTKNMIGFPPLFGMDLYVWKFYDLEVLVVSEPGRSCFSLFVNKNIVAILKSSQSTAILGHAGYKEWRLLSKDYHDINNDGFPDLIVGSMYSDDHGSPQRGIVKVLNGKLIYEKIMQVIRSFNDFEILQIDMDEMVLVSYTVPDQFVRNSSYEHFGSSFATTKSYSFIGLSSQGVVVIFEKETGVYKDCLSLRNSDQENLTAFQRKSLFGFNQILTGIYEDIEWIMISSVGFSYGIEYPLCGAVHFFVIQNGSTVMKATIVPSQRKGTNKENLSYSFFGSSMLKLGHNKVLVSSEGYLDGRGGLFLVELSSLINPSLENNFVVVADLLYVGNEGVGLVSLGTNSLDLAIVENKFYMVAGLSDFLFSSIPNMLTSTGAVSLIRLI
ncbi:hypothetical protein CANINC_004746 [Pichia inconspicua]|uniref:Phosphatidylinositol-glycan-specific phospholipase D n=1 Tax=Pichia inconspicua TaxID=52247 RepID=A0A4T0WWE1_9ASCO|nr:hypothetical protein CANINC_004746 [[Candida] inconspicua]